MLSYLRLYSDRREFRRSCEENNSASSVSNVITVSVKRKTFVAPVIFSYSGNGRPIGFCDSNLEDCK